MEGFAQGISSGMEEGVMDLMLLVVLSVWAASVEGESMFSQVPGHGIQGNHFHRDISHLHPTLPYSLTIIKSSSIRKSNRHVRF